MRKVPIIVLSLLLAAAIVGSVILYGRYTDTRGALAAAEKEVSTLNGKAVQLNEEKAALADRVREAAERLEAMKKLESELEMRDALVKELRAQQAGALSQVAALRQEVAKGVEEIEGLGGRLRELEQEKREKEKALGEVRERLGRLEREAEENRKTIAHLRDELSSKDGVIVELEGRLSALAGKEAQLKTELSEIKSAHDAMISGLKGEIQNREVTIGELKEKLSITFVDRVLFDSGSATITREGEGILAKVGEVLKGVKAKKIRVIGHTDDRPIADQYHYKFPSNWELSSSRAASVVRFFQEEIGILPEDMEAVGRSFYEPVASNETQEGRALNRRVNVIIAPRTE